jgi:hypothetical protein
MTQSKSDILKQYMELAQKLGDCFGSSGELASLTAGLNSYPVTPEVALFTAYRVIMLSPGLKDEGGKEGWRKAQLDWDRIKDSNTSWSKTLAGAKYYANKNNIEKYQIVLEAKVEGFHLVDYAQKVIEGAQAAIESSSLDEIMSAKNELNETLIEKIHGLKKAVAHFKKEDEIVGLKVVDYLILDHKHMADDIED